MYSFPGSTARWDVLYPGDSMSSNRRLSIVLWPVRILKIALIALIMPADGYPAFGQSAISGDIFSNPDAGLAQIVYQTGLDAAAPRPAVLYADGPYYYWPEGTGTKFPENAFRSGGKQAAAYIDVAMSEGCENLAVYIPVKSTDSDGIFCAAAVRLKFYEDDYADYRMGCAVSDSSGKSYVGYPYSREDHTNQWQYWKAETGLLHWEFPKLKFIGPALVLTRKKEHPNIRIVVRIYWDDVKVARLRPEEMPAIQTLIRRPHPCIDTNPLIRATAPYPQEVTEDPVLKVLKETIVVSALPGGYSMPPCAACGAKLKTDDGEHFVCSKCGRDNTTPAARDGYIQVVLRPRHLLLMGSMSAKYLKTGYRPYAEWVKDCLLKYAAVYKTIPVGWAGGRFRGNWLGDLYWAEPAVESYDRVIDVCSAREREIIENDLFRLMARTDYRFQGASYPEGYVRVARTVGKIGVILRDPELIYLCFYSPHTGFDAFGYFFDAEGLSQKYPIYHMLMLDGMDTIAQCIERGKDGVIAARRRFLMGAVDNTRFPDASLPAFAHSQVGYGARPGTAFVNLPSTNFMHTGLSFLRATTPKGPTCLAMHWGIPLRNDAGVMDIQYYALGRHLVRPSGTIGYEDKNFGEWFMHALSANTIVIDGANHEPVAGRLVYSSYAGAFRIVCARVDDLAPGVTMHRQAVLLPEGNAVIIDRVAALTPHTYDWVCHGLGKIEAPMALKAAPQSLGTGRGYSTLTNIFRSGPTDKEFTVEFQGAPTKDQSAVNLKLMMIQDSAGEVFTANGLEGYSTAPMLMIRREHTLKAVFVTIMEPRRPEEPSQIRQVSLEPVEVTGLGRTPHPAEALAVRIDMPERAYIVTSTTVAGEIRCGEFTSRQPAAVWVKSLRQKTESK